MTSGILAKGYDETELLYEETIDGAVYNTYLKRVPLQMRPWTWTENATHTLWNVQRVRCISAGTLPKLVYAMVMPNGELDTNYTNMFLCMFRTCATVEEVVNLILDRIKYWKSIEWRNRPKTALYIKAYIMVLSIWMKTYPEDFRQIPDYCILSRLCLHADEYYIGSYIKTKAEALIQRFQMEARQHWVEVTNEPSMSIERKIEPSRKNLLHMAPTIVAEQLTYKDAELLLNLVPYHCLGFYWGNKEQPADLATVHAVVSQYNYVSNIVISSVLKADQKPKHRVKVLEHWIQAAQVLRKLNSFSSLHAITRALKSPPIQRLRRTWAAVGKKVYAEYEEIVHMLSLDSNVFNSRNVLMEEATTAFYTTSKGQIVRKYSKEVAMQGTIPYLDLFLSELSHLDSAHPNKTAAGLINFDKRRQEFDILTQLMLLTKAAALYNFKMVPAVWKWFFSVCIYSEDESNKMSLSLEP